MNIETVKNSLIYIYVRHAVRKLKKKTENVKTDSSFLFCIFRGEITKEHVALASAT